MRPPRRRLARAGDPQARRAYGGHGHPAEISSFAAGRVAASAAAGGHRAARPPGACRTGGISRGRHQSLRLFDQAYRGFLELLAARWQRLSPRPRLRRGAEAGGGAGGSRPRQRPPSLVMSATSPDPLTLMLGPLEDMAASRKRTSGRKTAIWRPSPIATACGCCVWSIRCSIFLVSRQVVSRRSMSRWTSLLSLLSSRALFGSAAGRRR